jgi:hypothetical protein
MLPVVQDPHVEGRAQVIGSVVVTVALAILLTQKLYVAATVCPGIWIFNDWIG